MSGCSHPGLLLLGAEPAGAQPESTWSPARVREAGTGRNDVDTGEYRPTLIAPEQTGPDQGLDTKEVSFCAATGLESRLARSPQMERFWIAKSDAGLRRTSQRRTR